MKKFKVIIFLVLIISVCSIAYINYAKEFSDLPQTHWAYKYISELSDRGVINGYEDGSYKPSGTITRAEFLKLIVCEHYSKMQGFDELFQNSSSVGDNWYDLYVEMAQPIVPIEYSDEELKSPISRIEVASILNAFAEDSGFYKYTKEEKTMDLDDIIAQNKAIKQVMYDMGLSKKVDITDEELQTIMDKFPAKRNDEFFERLNKIYTPAEREEPYDIVVKTFDDVVDFGTTELLAVSNVARLGLLVGYEDGTFRPENNMTRAEVATVIYRFAEKRGEK